MEFHLELWNLGPIFELINRHTQLWKETLLLGELFHFFGVQNLGKKKPIVYFRVDFSFFFFFFLDLNQQSVGMLKLD